MENDKLERVISTSFAKVKESIVRNRYALLFCFVFSIIYVLPLIAANVYYLDDMGRAIYGNGWSHDGRGLSTFVMTKLTGGGGLITDYFPYSTIFSATIVAISGHILSSILGLDRGLKIKLSGLILLVNPFFLENLSFRWDAIPMAISILCVVVPFLFTSCSWLFILMSVLGICATMFTYQASVPIFLLMALLVLIAKCVNGDKDVLKSLALFAIGFVLGIASHKLLTWNVSLGDRASIIPFDENFWTVFSHNISVATDLIRSAFSTYFLVVVALSIVLAMVGLIKFLISDKPLLNKILAPLFSLGVIVIIPFTILILEVIYLGGRVLVTFPLFLYLLFIFVNYVSKKIVPYISVLFIILSFALMTSYANSLKNQEVLATNVSQKIAQTVDVRDKKMVFLGYLAHSPEAYGAIRKYPLFKYTVPTYLGDIWSTMFFAKANGYMYYPSFIEMSGDEARETIENKEQMPIVDETFYYVLRADSTRIIIDFDASKSKELKLNIPHLHD